MAVSVLKAKARSTLRTRLGCITVIFSMMRRRGRSQRQRNKPGRGELRPSSTTFFSAARARNAAAQSAAFLDITPRAKFWRQSRRLNQEIRKTEEPPIDVHRLRRFSGIAVSF